MSAILGEEDIAEIGHAMRMKRNADLYGGGEMVGEKEAADYLIFVQRVIGKVKSVIGVGS